MWLRSSSQDIHPNCGTRASAMHSHSLRDSATATDFRRPANGCQPTDSRWPIGSHKKPVLRAIPAVNKAIDMPKTGVHAASCTFTTDGQCAHWHRASQVLLKCSRREDGDTDKSKLGNPPYAPRTGANLCTWFGISDIGFDKLPLLHSGVDVEGESNSSGT
jgi:hypothetical protein